MNFSNKNNSKLIRDKIPELISESGRQPITRVLNDAEFLQALVSKLHEEVCEAAQEADNRNALIWELADVLEVVDALAAYHQILPNELLSAKESKRIQRGGFDKRLLLEKIL